MTQCAVLLLQMGGPDTLDDVEAFLFRLFCDRDIIKIGPAFLQPLIAKLISHRRAGKVAAHYEIIGGRSPLRELTQQQAEALERQLGPDYRCFVAMRYSRPDTVEALAAIKRAGISRIIALPLYPQYSRATSGSSFNELDRIADMARAEFEIIRIHDFHSQPLYIKALAEQIEKGLAGFSDRENAHILFSAHGLPQSFIDNGDPYLEQTEATVRLVMERFAGVTHHLAFQSRAGPAKWLEPSTDAKLAELAGLGVKQLLVVPVSFVSDHIETLYEIDIEYAQKAVELGITEFRRTGALNASTTFINCLAELVHAPEL